MNGLDAGSDTAPLLERERALSSTATKHYASVLPICVFFFGLVLSWYFSPLQNAIYPCFWFFICVVKTHELYKSLIQ
jgi:hypothetical protein